MMRFVILYPDSKAPVGKDWPDHTVDEVELQRRLTNNPKANVGVMLGPNSGVIDVECDSPEAEEVFVKLFGEGIRTPGWKSKRGSHRLFAWDDRLANLAGVLKHQGLEFRLGTGDAHQSVIPPSTVDGVKREWTLSLKDCDPAPLPESVIQLLLTLPPPAKGKGKAGKSAEIPAARKAKVERLLRYCRRHGIKVTGMWENHDGLFFLGLDHCPFKGPESQRGAPVFIVFPDGGHCFKCLHPDCGDKTFANIESLYGPLYPDILIGTDLERAVNQSIQALADDPDILQRGPLVHVVHDAKRPKQCKVDHGGPQIRPISKATLRTKLTSAAHYWKYAANANEPHRCVPTDHVVDAVLAAPAYDGIPVVTGIASCPILRPDGTIAARRGYDPETGVWLDIDGDFPPLMEPKEAAVALLDVVCDFPFVNEQHRAAWVAQPVTFVSRFAFGGRVPFMLTDGNHSGVGKGLALDATTMIYEDRPSTRYGFPKDQDELRKVITTIVMSGVAYHVIDNVKGKLGGPILEKALTDARWSDRLLGVNRDIDLPIHHITMATGNNCQLTPDMVRRTLYSRLESPEEDPSKRTGFKHNPLLGFIHDTRKRLLMACLSIPYHYIKANRPDQKLPPWGEPFQQWSDLVRNALVWAGLPDPDTRKTLATQVDDDSGLLAAIMEAWPGPATVAEAISKAEVGEAPALLAALEELPHGEKRKHALGQLLKHHRGRVVKGRRFEKTDHAHPKWQVVQSGVSPSGGSPA
jgi:hypothetical protein